MYSSHPIVFSQGKVSYVSQDARCVPPVLWKLYGDKAHCLDLSYNRLVSLDGLQEFSCLTELILDNNELTDSLQIPSLPALQTLSLNNNRITNIEMLISQIKKNVNNLEYLSLLGNIACPNQLSDVDKDEEDYQRYRYFVLHHLPGLRFLDSRVVTDIEWAEGRRIGHLMKVARPSITSILGMENSDLNNDVMSGSLLPGGPQNTYCRTSPEPEIKPCLTPLPSARISRGPQGIYGKCVYRYTGKHSEGNRFIRNHQL